MKRRFTNLILAVLLISLPTYGGEPSAPAEEYKIKAALIYQLTKFVEWPLGVFSQPDSPFKICLFGENPFAGALRALAQRRVGDHPISITFYDDVRAVGKSGCHILYISEQPIFDWSEIVSVIGNLPILTISDTKGFADAGGIIELARKDNRIGFNINIAAARRARLKMAASLLNLSTVIRDGYGVGGR